MGHANNETWEMRNNCGKATIVPASQDHWELIPASLSQQTIPDHTVGPELTINVKNYAAKI
jgi:hypothetical protein